MMTEFEAILEAVRLSKNTYPDEVLVLFKKPDSTYGICLESEYLGDDEAICERYLNGCLARL